MLSQVINFTLGLGLSTLSVPFLLVSYASAIERYGQQFDPSAIRFCVNQLLYDHTFPDGTPAGDRTIIDPASATIACRGVITVEEAQSVRKCVNGLLYESTFSNGNPVGERTIIDAGSAARACSLCKNG